MTNIEIVNNATNIKVTTEDTRDGKRVIIETAPDQVKLEDIKLGGAFQVGRFVFVKTKDGYVLRNLLNDGKKYKFGDNNNYAESDVREMLNGEFYRELAGIVGIENIIEHEVDLMSLDGLKDYGKCRDKVSLLTLRMYQDNREYIPLVDDWYWLATGNSTPSGYPTHCVLCVGSNGDVDCDDCSYSGGVRPFCIFKPSIFVSPVN